MRIALQRFLAIAGKELRQLLRDRLTFGLIVGVPLIQIVLFGYAINQDVRDLRAGVSDLAASQASRALVADMQASQVVHIVAHTGSAAELDALMRQGRIAVGVVIPEDFERRLQDSSRPAAQLLVDGADPIILSIVQRMAEMPRPHAVTGAANPSPLFALRTYYNPERRSSVNIVPGLIGVILNLTMILFTSVAIVRERERGNLEMLITTPVRTVELMAGKIVPYIMIGLVQVSIILLAGALLFSVPVVGSLWSLYIAALVFISAALALGLLISTVAQTQFQAMQLTVFSFLPSILLSGFMFPFDGMPRAAQWIGEIIPLTHFVRLARGILLRGAGLGDLMPEIWAMLAFSAVMMTVAMRRFRKRLD